MKLEEFKKKFKVVRNPLKEKFKKLKISNGELGNYLGISASRANQFLNGFTPTPSEIQKKLQELAEGLKE